MASAPKAGPQTRAQRRHQPSVTVMRGLVSLVYSLVFNCMLDYIQIYLVLKNKEASLQFLNKRGVFRESENAHGSGRLLGHGSPLAPRHLAGPRGHLPSSGSLNLDLVLAPLPFTRRSTLQQGTPNCPGRTSGHRWAGTIAVSGRTGREKGSQGTIPAEPCGVLGTRPHSLLVSQRRDRRCIRVTTLGQRYSTSEPPGTSHACHC